ncbi:MAG: hypothetical protein ACO1N0_00785 [Fluviicola sp.]
MRKAVFLIILLIPITGFSQKDNFRLLFGANFGRAYMGNNKMVPPTVGYYNQSWNEDGITHNYIYGTETSNYTCNIFSGQVGVSVPFARIKRISFGVEPKLGMGVLRSNEHINKYNTLAVRNVKSFLVDATGLLYVRCRLGEQFHISLLGGYRFVWTKYNYQSPVVGLEFGMDYFRVGVYGYMSGLHYDRQLSNGETYPVEAYYDLGSVSLYYTMGKKWFDK